MEIIKDKITVQKLEEMAEKMFGNLVKAMVDVEKEIMAVDAPMHADLLELLIEKNPSVAIHFAKTKLRDRGYAEKIELEHTGNMGVTFNLIEKPLEEIKNARPNNNTQTEGTAQSP